MGAIIKNNESFLLLLFLQFFLLVSGKPSHYHSSSSVPFNRTLFPSTFVFGAGSSAYQFEGAVDTDGRGPSIWDTFTKQHPEKIKDHSSGAVAEDLYHRYKDDIKLMKKIGLDSFRFSISWSRMFPKGKGKVNHLGVQFYNNLINELLSNDIMPFVTLFHWDLPQALEDEYGGFLSPKIVEDYRKYVDFCFKTFGDRVKHWATLNEPFSYSNNGYNSGIYAPDRCSSYVGNCTGGNSATEPYIVSHHLLLAHAAGIQLYRNKYQRHQKGQIGITLITHWMEPKSNSAADRAAASRALDFWFGWFAHPITYGDYPESMRSIVGDRLPKFTKEESKLLKGSYDFLGVNYYTSTYVQSAPANNINKSYTADIQATLSGVRNGVPIGIPTDQSWLFIYPKGLHQLLVYVKEKYQNPTIWVTENGVADTNNNASKPVKVAVRDSIRILYYKGHVRSVLQALKDGVNIKGYFAWSFLDDFEWEVGYTVGYGITFVDFKNNLTRYLKHSAYWYKNFLLH